MLDLNSILTAFLAIFIVMDPFSSIPVFISLTKKYSPEKKKEAAAVASAVAAAALIGFLLFGPAALSFLNIRLESFEIAGGLLMLAISFSFALGIDFGKKEDTPVEAVIIGVPLLSGPGTMLTSVLLSSTIGMENVAVAGIGACLASYLILRACGFINKMIGANGVEILSRIMGVLLAAFAVEYIRRGLGL